MAKGKRSGKRSLGSRLIGLINPIRDPSLLIAAILTVITQGGPTDNPVRWGLIGVGNWIAVKAVIWLLVNFAFSFVYLFRKAIWVLRNPRLAWRLLDALGTEEIIIGGLRPDMFATDEGLHPGQLGAAAMAAAAYGQGLRDPYMNDSYGPDNYSRPPRLSERLDGRVEDMQQLVGMYARLLGDWMNYTEEKWRAVSDSQLGWKPLRGRWNGWEEIYRDSYVTDDRAAAFSPGDPMARRFDNSQGKGSAASAVVCFLRDLDQLRQGMTQIEGDEAPGPRQGPVSQRGVPQRTGKGPVIRDPRMIVDADQ